MFLVTMRLGRLSKCFSHALSSFLPIAVIKKEPKTNVVHTYRHRIRVRVQPDNDCGLSSRCARYRDLWHFVCNFYLGCNDANEGKEDVCICYVQMKTNLPYICEEDCEIGDCLSTSGLIAKF